MLAGAGRLAWQLRQVQIGSTAVQLQNSIPLATEHSIYLRSQESWSPVGAAWVRRRLCQPKAPSPPPRPQRTSALRRDDRPVTRNDQIILNSEIRATLDWRGLQELYARWAQRVQDVTSACALQTAVLQRQTFPKRPPGNSLCVRINS